MPFSDCSSGIVTSDSTSAADKPIAEVWISTRGGANSGKTSTGIVRSCCTPKNIIAAAHRDDEVPEPEARVDDPAQHGGSARSRYSSPTSYSLPSSSAAPTVTTSVPGAGPAREQRRVALDANHLDRRAHEHEGLGTGVRPCIAGGVVEHGGIGDRQGDVAGRRAGGLPPAPSGCRAGRPPPRSGSPASRRCPRPVPA